MWNVCVEPREPEPLWNLGGPGSRFPDPARCQTFEATTSGPGSQCEKEKELKNKIVCLINTLKPIGEQFPCSLEPGGVARD